MIVAVTVSVGWGQPRWRQLRRSQGAEMRLAGHPAPSRRPDCRRTRPVARAPVRDPVPV